MKIWNGLEEYPSDLPPLSASIGNYDGVHLGHRAILDGVTAAAARRGTRSLLITFEPHPVQVLAPQRTLRLLQTRRQKLDELERTGLDATLLVRFTPELAELDGHAFMDGLFDAGVRLAEIHVGENFRFGHRRSGDLSLLREIGARRGFEVRGVSPVTRDGEPVSSSSIRRAVAEGCVERVRELLGRPYSVEGPVVAGAGRGSKLDYPTANLAVENEILPRNGVYVSETTVLARRVPSLTNVGVRPTFGGDGLTVETHLLDFDEDLYGERIELGFLARLRDEREFSDAEELADQIARDRAAAVSFFDHLQIRSR